MPMLFNCLVAVLFLLALDSVYVNECTEVCEKNVYPKNHCPGLCSRTGAYSLYCHLRCGQMADTADEYNECIDRCKGGCMNKFSCRDDCIHVTRLPYMCKGICQHDEESVLNRCLYSCVSKFPPLKNCQDKESGGANCEDPEYRKCSNQCYKDDEAYLKWRESQQ